MPTPRKPKNKTPRVRKIMATTPILGGGANFFANVVCDVELVLNAPALPPTPPKDTEDPVDVPPS